MATISQYRGKWKAQVRKEGYPTKTKTFELRSDALAWGAETEARLNRGISSPKTSKQKTTVEEVLSRYLAEESSRKAYPAADISRSKPLLAALGGYHVHNLSHADLAKYKATRLAAVSPQTVTHELNLLHRAYVLAVNEWGAILPNGIPKTSRPRLPPGRGARISPEEIDRIVKVTESPQLKLIVPLAVETAMRRSELLAIRWENVNLSRCSIYLPRTKNGTSRTVPLSSKALAVIGELEEAKEGPLFTLAASSVSQAFDRAVIRAGLKGVRFHDLRHEGISRMFEKNLNVMEVACLSGHKDFRMLKRYTHLIAAKLAKKLG